MLGTTINNRYRIDAELGKGGMGTVYRGHDTTLERDVAVKVLSRSELGTEGQARLLREAQVVAKLDHPNIVAVHDAGEFEGNAFIVMQSVEGETLAENKPETLEKIIAIAKQICMALVHAHKNEIVHRDLKPENVLIDASGNLKLMDFGLARSISSRLTSAGMIVGTVFYLAPELAMGQEFDGRADLYALGVMLYELTTRELPFIADDQVAVISQHLHAPVVHPRAKNKDIPPLLNDLIVRLLSKDPSDRPSSAREVLNSLETSDIVDTEAAPAEELPLLDRIVRGRMVGRKQELSQALNLWNKVHAGEGQMLLISGEPGIGKTRLMREVATHAEVSNGQVLVGECHPEGNAPYAAFAHITRRALRRQTGKGMDLPKPVLAELLSLAPELRTDYPEIEPNPKLEPEAEQRRLFDNMVRFCIILAEQSPLLLVLEDIHWADSGSLHLLQHLARRTPQLKVMLLGTYREVELDEALPFNEMLMELSRRRFCTRIKLGRLDKKKTRDLLEVIFAEEITTEFLDSIYEETEGNPFFIEEVCKTLVENGELYYEDGHWQRPSMEKMYPLPVPQSVRVTIQSRVNTLADETQGILLTAAVIGREFDYQTLKKVTEKNEDILLDSLEEVISAQLVVEVKEGGGEQFYFSHALIPAALREGVSGLRQTRLHRKVAEVIEELHPEEYERLAHHWGEGGDEERGLAYSIKAAGRAKETYANEDAIRFYSEALDLIPEEHPERFDLLAGRASVYDVIAKREAQIADTQEMLALAEKQGDDTRRLEAMLAQAEAYVEGEPLKARALLEEVVEKAKEINNPILEGQALLLLGHQAKFTYDWLRSQKVLEAAVERFRQADLPAETAQCMSMLSVVLGDLGQTTAALKAAEEAVVLCKAADDLALEATALRRLGISHATLYQFQDALPYVETALKLHEKIGDLTQKANALNALGFIHAGLRNSTEAEKFYLQALQMGHEIGDTTVIRFVVGNIGMLYKNQQGDYEKNMTLVEDQLIKVKLTKDELLEEFVVGEKTNLLLILGKLDQALRLNEERIHFLDKMYDRGNQALFLAFTGRLHAELGNFEEANEYIRAAYERIEGEEEEINKARVDNRAALVAWLEGKPSKMHDALEKVTRVVDSTKDKKGNVLPILVFALLTKASLHLALIETDDSHADKALECTQKVLHLAEIDYEVGLPEMMLHLHSSALRANGREEEADEYLRRAYERVMMVAGKKMDDDLRQCYLENVRWNREIIAACRERGIG
jgi:predicted ATPase